MISDDDFEDILADLAAGIPLRKSISSRRIDPTTFYRELRRDDDRCQRYARAKDVGMDAIADDAMGIADAALATNEEVAKARLQIDTRKWFLAKLAPKKYGERTVLAGDADNPLAIADVTAAVLGKLLPEAATGDAPETPSESDS